MIKINKFPHTRLHVIVIYLKYAVRTCKVFRTRKTGYVGKPHVAYGNPDQEKAYAKYIFLGSYVTTALFWVIIVYICAL